MCDVFKIVMLTNRIARKCSSLLKPAYLTDLIPTLNVMCNYLSYLCM